MLDSGVGDWCLPEQQHTGPAAGVVRATRLLQNCLAIAIPSAADLILRRTDVRELFIKRVVATVGQFGGAPQKICQVLASRPDLLSQTERALLGTLCDHSKPDSPSVVAASLRDGLSSSQRLMITALEPEPIGSGAVAQVHVARIRGMDTRVALKVLRSTAISDFSCDLSLLAGLVGVGARLPWARNLPLLAAWNQISRAVYQQLNFRQEASAQRQLKIAFSENSTILIPEIVHQLCSDRTIAMQYISDAQRIDDPGLSESLRQDAIRAALRALYFMIFRVGLVHCDMHPGNLLVTPEGRLVLIDFGYTANLTRVEQDAFAALFMATMLGDVDGVVDVMVATAAFVPGDLEIGAVKNEVGELLSVATHAEVAGFSVIAYARSLFEIQCRHGMAPGGSFAMVIVSLLTFEGLLKTFTGDLDFQREAAAYIA